MSVTEQLHKVIDELKEEINKDNKKCTLVFRIKNGKFYKFEKSFSMLEEDIGIEITD